MADDRHKIVPWGANSYGQLCCGHTQDIAYPEQTVPSPKGGILYLTGGGGHTALVSSKGELYLCGWNNKGQLGLGDTVDRASLTHVSSLPVIKWIACGWSHSMATTVEGSLFVFGSNAFGQLGLGMTGGSHIVMSPCQISLGCKVTHVAAGLRHSLAVLEDGSVWSWGDNKRCQLGIPGLKSKTVATPTKVTALTDNVCQVAAGSHHSAALTENGQVFCWGSNRHGQCGKPVDKDTNSHQNIYDKPQLISGALTNKNVKSILCGWSHLLVKTENNHIYTWGRADYGQLGLGDYIVREGYSCQPSRIPSLDHVTQSMCGAEHNIALLDSGEVLTWGWNEHSICGTTDGHNVHTPRTLSIAKGRNITLVGCGGGHTFIVIATS